MVPTKNESDTKTFFLVKILKPTFYKKKNKKEEERKHLICYISTTNLRHIQDYEDDKRKKQKTKKRKKTITPFPLTVSQAFH